MTGLDRRTTGSEAPAAERQLPDGTALEGHAPQDPPAAAPGVGPHPRPWPDDPRLDPALLVAGDHRNVVDSYRYWSVEAIVADLDTRRHPLHIAIENWEHDFNIGSMVRTANAFNVEGVHIVGRRRWNRRGAMVTDRYLHVQHHPDAADLADWARQGGIPLIGVDNLPGSVPLERTTLPRACCLVFGSEGAGLTDDMVAACQQLVAITQHGSTRSINAGAAAAITMYHWALRWAGTAGAATEIGGTAGASAGTGGSAAGTPDGFECVFNEEPPSVPPAGPVGSQGGRPWGATGLDANRPPSGR